MEGFPLTRASSISFRIRPSSSISVSAWAMILRSSTVAFRYSMSFVTKCFPVFMNYFPVRSFDKSVFIDAGIAGQMIDKTDVRAFRSLHRTNPPVMGLVHVTHFKAGPLAGETSRPHGRKPSFVLELRQRIHLIHKLRELRGSKKFLDSRRHRTGIDKLSRDNRRQIEVLIRSLIFRAIRASPARNLFCTSSPTQRTRRFPK